jgi:hypothetical protein
MTKMLPVLSALILLAAVGSAARQGIRVVDSVDLSVARDEAAHAFAGAEMQVGEAAGRTWRSASGWFSYSLRIYDDSPLTLVFLFSAGTGAREAFDILVDGKKVATVDRDASRQKTEEARFDVPFAQTKGKFSVTVKVQTHAGSRTARVLEIWTVQEHLE